MLAAASGGVTLGWTQQQQQPQPPPPQQQPQPPPPQQPQQPQQPPPQQQQQAMAAAESRAKWSAALRAAPSRLLHRGTCLLSIESAIALCREMCVYTPPMRSRLSTLLGLSLSAPVTSHHSRR